MEFVIDVALVVAVVAFVQKRVPALKGDLVLVAAFVVVLVLAFLPDVVALFPQSQYAVEKIIMIIKLFLSAPGLVDAYRLNKK